MNIDDQGRITRRLASTVLHLTPEDEALAHALALLGNDSRSIIAAIKILLDERDRKTGVSEP